MPCTEGNSPSTGRGLLHQVGGGARTTVLTCSLGFYFKCRACAVLMTPSRAPLHILEWCQSRAFPSWWYSCSCWPASPLPQASVMAMWTSNRAKTQRSIRAAGMATLSRGCPETHSGLGKPCGGGECFPRVITTLSWAESYFQEAKRELV